MILNKEEFKILVMLYAANIDGQIQSEEVKIMLEKADFGTVNKVEKIFFKMNDAEVINVIKENKPLYANSEAERLEMLADVCAIIEADEKCTSMEQHIVRTMRRLLEA